LEVSEVTNQDRTIRHGARASIVAFLPACIAIVIAVATGIAWLGQPLRLVQLVTLIGVSMVAGVAWAQAVSRLRRDRS
jgi:Flp pilus assembly protein TadB